MFLFNTPPPGLLERAPQLRQIAASFRAAFVALCKHGKRTSDAVRAVEQGSELASLFPSRRDTWQNSGGRVFESPSHKAQGIFGFGM